MARRHREPGGLQDRLVAGQSAPVPRCGAPVFGIGLVPVDVEERFRVDRHVVLETSPDHPEPFEDLPVEVQLHDLEGVLLQDAVASDIFLVEFVDRRAVVLQIGVRVLAVHVEDDLAHGLDGLSVQLCLRWREFGRRLDDHLDSVRLSRPGHPEERRPLA